MQAILARCQRRIGGWVGSSVVHLGDHNVPNALSELGRRAGVSPALLLLVFFGFSWREGGVHGGLLCFVLQGFS